MKFKEFVNRYFSKPAVGILLFTALCLAIMLISVISPVFSDFFNRYISSLFRLAISKITGVLPFSLGEAVFLSLPVFIFTALFLYFKVYSEDDIKAGRFVAGLFSCVCFMFCLFVITFGTAYNGTQLSEKLDLEQKDVSYEELEHTALCLIEEIDSVIASVDYRYNGASVMNYSFDELNDEMNKAYKSFSDKNEFIQPLSSNVKIIGVSPVMTYTHISGIFTYYTAEANLNINYPDYTIPYTMAHEMAHQRGIAPEDEANFVAFLVCLESEDPYIRYSGCMNMLEYVMSAMNKADRDRYSEFVSTVDLRIRGEMTAFSEFFDRYRRSIASDVTNAINDTYIKATGDEHGSASYGMVVDLACAFYSE